MTDDLTVNCNLYRRLSVDSPSIWIVRLPCQTEVIKLYVSSLLFVEAMFQVRLSFHASSGARVH